MALYGDDSGKESEWNEATFKSKRLHEIQNLINFYKSNPLGVTEGKFNYVHLFRSIEMLYGEGRSKYSGKEKIEMDTFRETCKKSLKFMPPHISQINNSIKGNSQTFRYNEKNYEMLSNLLYDFEMRVRDLNDEHGLTTKNKQGQGMF